MGHHRNQVPIYVHVVMLCVDGGNTALMDGSTYTIKVIKFHPEVSRKTWVETFLAVLIIVTIQTSNSLNYEEDRSSNLGERERTHCPGQLA